MTEFSRTGTCRWPILKTKKRCEQYLVLYNFYKRKFETGKTGKNLKSMFIVFDLRFHHLFKTQSFCQNKIVEKYWIWIKIAVHIWLNVKKG